MDATFRTSLWLQFGAAIDQLENAITNCPDEHWDTDVQFWYNAYHVLFFLDLYLDEEPRKFMPPEPFDLNEMDPSGKMPERTFTKEELINYLHHCRQKCHDLIASLTPEKMEQRWETDWRNYSLFEMIMYNMRHVQHHVGQLNTLLRKEAGIGSRWVAQTKVQL